MWAVNMLSGESRKSVAVASAVRLLLRPLDWREYKQVTVLPGACSDRRESAPLGGHRGLVASPPAGSVLPHRDRGEH